MASYEDFVQWYKNNRDQYPGLSVSDFQEVFEETNGPLKPEREPIAQRVDGSPSHMGVSRGEFNTASTAEAVQGAIDNTNLKNVGTELKDSVLRNSADILGIGGDIANVGAQKMNIEEYSSPVDSDSIRAMMKEKGLITNERENLILDTVLSLLTPSFSKKLGVGVPVAENAVVEGITEGTQLVGDQQDEY